jgi:hypothetical protein
MRTESIVGTRNPFKGILQDGDTSDEEMIEPRKSPLRNSFAESLNFLL